MVIFRLYEIEMGSCNANEPIKCMAQVPMPIAKAPKIIQSDWWRRESAALIRSVIPNAVNAEIIAMMTDRMTR